MGANPLLTDPQDKYNILYPESPDPDITSRKIIKIPLIIL